MPAIYLGIHSKKLGARTVIAGLIVGILLTLTLIIFDMSRVSGIHAGIIGLAANLAICLTAMIKNKYTQDQIH